jgi:hypothetical protein
MPIASQAIPRPAPVAPEPPQAVASTIPPAQPSAPKVYGQGEQLGYKAVQGDTLPNVVVGLAGSDTKKNRDAVIAANPSLESNPDRVLTGKTYVVPEPQAAATVTVAPPADPIPATQPAVSEAAHSDSDRVLKYTAQPGDNVSNLAAGLLGGDSKTNRDAIISRNVSLQNDPDHVVTGKTYKIPTTSGLSAAPTPVAIASPAPATQPDADGVVQIGTGRELRYKARVGDNVNKLALVLLGSDTQANRDAIINNNASLKSDPDRVIAGQTYWIPAPVASIGD